MSKLIVDDIELASGDNFSIPDEIQQDKLIKVSGGKITEFEDLPTGGEYKLVHDFSTGQPETITHTFSTNSNNLMGFHLVFEGMRCDSNPTSLDIGWDVKTAADDSHANYFANYKYNSLAQYETNQAGTNTTQAASYRDLEVHMAPMRDYWGIGVGAGTGDHRNIGTYDHYCFFWKNANQHSWRAFGNYNATDANTSYEIAWNRVPNQAITWDTNGLATDQYWPSEPYTKLVINTRESEGFNVHAGKIKIMEMVL